MSEAWTIERVEIRTPEDRKLDYFSGPLDIPPNVAQCVAYGRMSDGRAFHCETWSTMDFLNDVGEDRLREIIKEMAHPPEDGSRNIVGLGFTD